MKISVWPVLLAAAVFSVGCQRGFSERAQVGKENILRYPIVANPTTMDPALVQDGDTIDLLQQMYEGLVGWGPDNEPIGLLAEKWEVTNNGATYIFTLRDAKFHNGRTVTADDVKWSFERAADPKIASPVVASYFTDIVGIEDKLAGRAKDVRGVKVIDPKTVQIDIKEPIPYFLGKLTYLAGAVLPKEVVPADGPITDIKQMIGTGPFKMEAFSPNQLVKLTAFADYHGGAPKLAGIERPVIGDPATRLSKFKNGELDMVQLERKDLPALQKDEQYKDQIQLFDRPAIWYVGMNQAAYPPFKDRRVRQAFAMAIDKDRIVNVVLGGVNKVANGIVPPGVPGHREDAAALPYDPARAKQLLAEAGYPNGQGLPELTMTFREARPDIKLAAEAVVSQLRENLGLDIKLQTMEWGAYLEAYNRKEQRFYHMRWAADYLDPQNFLSLMLSTDGAENKTGYSNPEFDRLCAQADKLMDMNQRLPLYAQAEDIVLQDAPWVPIYFQRDAELHRPGLTGLRESLFGHLPHTTTELTPTK